jgi:hypothetical protein
MLAILGGIYFIISWSFGIVKTLIRPNLLGFVSSKILHLLFWGLTTSFLVERAIYLASCTFIDGVGFLGIHTCGLFTYILWITCHFWRLVMEHSPRSIILLFYLSFTLEAALCELS